MLAPVAEGCRGGNDGGDPVAANVATFERVCREIRTLDQDECPAANDLPWAGVIA